MKPAKFAYHAPASVTEAVEILQHYAGEARVLAGGQSLVPMMNFRLVTPAALVDLNRIPELQYIRHEGGLVRIGAMTRQRALEASDVVAAELPLLAEAVGLIGHAATRSRGTIGGSLAHADPAAELPMVLMALDGEVTAVGPAGERRIAAAELFRGSLATSLGPEEILTEVRFPPIPATGVAVEEFARRHGDFAIVGIAAVIERDGDACIAARLATCGVSTQPVRLGMAEAILEREGLGERAIADAADAAAEAVEPIADGNGSAEYRRHLTRVLTRRAVIRAGRGPHA